MPSKGQKKIVSKHKQNGKRILKSHAYDASIKHEAELGTKEPILELEKELLFIKINELEAKVTRKNQLCSILEGEKNLYNILYKEKKLLKKDSMMLLNTVYKEFFTEILLLENELSAMEYNYECLLKEKEFCIDSVEQVKRLSDMEVKLEQRLMEVEMGVEAKSALESKLKMLQAKKYKIDDELKAKLAHLSMQFDIFSNGLQDDIKLVIESIIKDKDLKLELLPMSYQALFSNGMIRSSLLKSVFDQCLYLLSQNIALKRHSDEMQCIRRNVQVIATQVLSKIYISIMAKDYVSKCNSEANQFNIAQTKLHNWRLCEDLDQQLRSVENKNMLQANKVKDIQAEIERVENMIKSHEISDEHLWKSSIVQIINTAGNIIKLQIWAK